MTLTPEYLADLRRQIDQRLGEIYPEGPQLLCEPIRYVLAAGGKRLRPILTLLTTTACRGAQEDSLHAAVAVEILHNFTLVHDDLMDRDHTRHAQPTVHARWDDGVAVLAGDAMFILALAEIRRSSRSVDTLTAAFTQGALAVCEGQALDKEFETDSRIALEDYLRMVDLKTGYLLGLSAELGAICAGVDQTVVVGVRRFGQLLGRAFQIQDDLLEIFSNSQNMGKSLGSDLLAEKKTYLMIEALEKAPEDIQEALDLARSNIETGLAKLRAILEEKGIRAEAEVRVRQTIDQALAELAPLGADQGPLLEFAELVLNRKK